MISVEAPTRVARWPLVRVRVGEVITCQLLCGQFVRLVTHFHKTTFLCPEVEECDACELLPGRPYWYLPVQDCIYKRHGLLELSAHACSDLEQKVRFSGFALRPGIQVELSRRSAKKPVGIEILGSSETCPSTRPEEWVSALMAVYGLPALHPGETIDGYGERVKTTAVVRANLRAAAYKLDPTVGVKGRGKA